MKPRGIRNRRLHRFRRGRTDETSPPIKDEPEARPGPEPATGVGWDHTAEPIAPPSTIPRPPEQAPLAAQILGLLSDPRIDAVTVEAATRALGQPRQDVETTLEAMVQGGQLIAVGGRYGVTADEKQRLEAMFRAAAHEIGEHGVLVRATPEDALATMDDEVEEPRLPVTAGLLSLFLPGTGQLLNGDVGRASLVFAVWSLAWITHLSPVWTFVCLYAGAEAFFTAKIRSMERRLAREAAGRHPGRSTPPALPPTKNPA